MKRSRIKPVSKKRRALNAEYLKVRRSFLERNPCCQVCGRPSTEIHHKNGREGKWLIDEEFFLPTCSPCHARIHHNPSWAKESGFLLNRHS